MFDRTERTIRPDEEGWKKILGGQGEEGTQAEGPRAPGPQQQTQPGLESSITAAHPIGSVPSLAKGTAAGYPLQLRLDVTYYLYNLLKGDKSLPVTPAIESGVQGLTAMENPAAFVHAKLLVENLGLEGFTIRNYAKNVGPQHYASLDTFKFASQFTTQSAIKVGNVRNYLASLAGEEALRSPLASGLMSAQLEELVEVSTLPMLMPHMPEIAFLAQLRQSKGMEQPFNSPYFIVMEVEPPNARLLIAKTLSAAYQNGTMKIPPHTVFKSGNFNQVESYETAEKREVMSHRQELSATMLRDEAQKLGIQTSSQHLSQCIDAYREAWDHLYGRLK